MRAAKFSISRCWATFSYKSVDAMLISILYAPITPDAQFACFVVVGVNGKSTICIALQSYWMQYSLFMMYLICSQTHCEREQKSFIFLCQLAEKRSITQFSGCSVCVCVCSFRIHPIFVLVFFSTLFPFSFY